MADEALNVLVVDDDPITVRVVAHVLQRAGHRIAAAENAELALDFVCNSECDVVITDWQLPGMSGADLCREIRARDAQIGRYVYLVLMTARNRSQGLIEGFTAGADDFISKPVDGDELRVRLLAARRVLQLERRLRFLAEHDSLTSLLNRRAFLERGEIEWQRSVRYGRQLSCIMVDVDRFKAVNDRFGHFAGDAVLTMLAKLIRQMCRSSELVGRFGGEEFCVLLPETDRHGAVAFAERVRRAIRSTPVFWEDRPIRVTASFGVAEADATMPDLAALINAADTALLEAKRNGRDQVCCYAPQAPKLLEGPRTAERAGTGDCGSARSDWSARDESPAIGPKPVVAGTPASR